jgi:hypothetical protein
MRAERATGLPAKEGMVREQAMKSHTIKGLPDGEPWFQLSYRCYTPTQPHDLSSVAQITPLVAVYQDPRLWLHRRVHGAWREVPEEDWFFTKRLLRKRAGEVTETETGGGNDNRRGRATVLLSALRCRSIRHTR